MFEGIPKYYQKICVDDFLTVHNLKGSLDNIKGNTHQVELKQLEFHAFSEKGVF